MSANIQYLWLKFFFLCLNRAVYIFPGTCNRVHTSSSARDQQASSRWRVRRRTWAHLIANTPMYTTPQHCLHTTACTGMNTTPSHCKTSMSDPDQGQGRLFAPTRCWRSLHGRIATRIPEILTIPVCCHPEVRNGRSEPSGLTRHDTTRWKVEVVPR